MFSFKIYQIKKERDDLLFVEVETNRIRTLLRRAQTLYSKSFNIFYWLIVGPYLVNVDKNRAEEEIKYCESGEYVLHNILEYVQNQQVALWFRFSRFSSVATSSHRRTAQIKKLTDKRGVDTFPDPVGHFGAPYRPFWGHLEAFLDLAGNAVLQVVSERPRRH